MNESIFFRLLKEEDKESALRRCLTDLHQGRDNELIHTVRQETFALLPGSPMPYWVSDAMRRKFADLPPLERDGAKVRRGLGTNDDFRFLRLAVEIKMLDLDQKWCRFAKGGEFSEYYDDIHLVVEWSNNGQALKDLFRQQDESPSRNVRSETLYFKPGLTYPLATVKGLNVRIMPAQCIFGSKGPAVFPREQEYTDYLLGLLNTRLFRQFLLMQTPSRSWEVGYVQAVPYIAPRLATTERISKLARQCHDLKRALDWINEISHAFTQPALLGVNVAHLEIPVDNLESAPQNLKQHFLTWLATKEVAEVRIIENTYQIDQTTLDLYGISQRDRRTIDRELGPHPGSYPRRDEWTEAGDDKLRLLYLTKEFLPKEDEASDDGSEGAEEQGGGGAGGQEVESMDEDNGGRRAAVGGRRARRATYRSLEEIAQALQVHPASVAARRRALGLYRPDDLAEAVADLISYCIGCLFGRWDIRVGGGVVEPPALPDPEAGLPLYPPAALRPDSPPLEPVGLLAQVIERSARHGLLVDDPGHPHDLVAGIEACLAYLFGEDHLSSLRAEIAAALGREVRPWLANTFFSLHLKRYSKSRRKAPIYWQLATPTRRYSLWLYYHALKPETLYTAVHEYVSPKIAFEEGRLKEMQAKVEQVAQSGPAREARRLEKAGEDQEGFLQELYAFRSELHRLADWGYQPDLDDGVIINIAPLHRLVPWPEARKMWQALEKGEYEWSTMAKNIKQRKAAGSR